MTRKIVYLLQVSQNINVMSINKNTTKKIIYQQQVGSPRYNYHNQPTITQKIPQSKLVQKVQRLKNALRASQKHSQQLHNKLKQYKGAQNEEMANLYDELKTNRKKIQRMQTEHNQQIDRLKSKLQNQIRAVSTGKINTQQKTRELEIQIKTKDMKIVQLQSKIRDQSTKIRQRQQQIRQLQKQLQRTKQETIEQQNRKTYKIKNHLPIKVSEGNENKQILRLKQLLKESLKKVEKSSFQVHQINQKNRLLQDQLKQNRKIMEKLERQSALHKQSESKIKQEIVDKTQQLRALQKSILQYQFNEKKTAQKNLSLNQQHQKLQTQFKSLLAEYQLISSKYHQLVLNQSQLQRDFQKQLHSIVKQLIRRQTVSRKLIASMVGNKIFTFSKQNQVKINQ